MLLNALVGWTNTATYGSVSSYIAYWMFVVALLKTKEYREKHGRLPFVPLRYQLKAVKKRIAFQRILIHDYTDQYHDLASNISINEVRPSAESNDVPVVNSAHPSEADSETSNLITSAH
ncbi:unnamed protein product [Ambrosiozyma monospora]|uniref:Unnamed protein product n=1 Tax=Ambrosiozyma monospora TaxID=43982 RepID=A0ACB5U233_AMBMO|nr:unnamed protein product [Ambrosiozyma monospora]